jgi:hypothetical protein
MYQLGSKVMTSDQKNSTALEHSPGTPYPPPPRFDEAMIAAAQPVEPLVTNQTLSGRQITVRRSLKNKLALIAAVLIATFLSAAFGGSSSGLREWNHARLRVRRHRPLQTKRRKKQPGLRCRQPTLKSPRTSPENHGDN